MNAGQKKLLLLLAKAVADLCDEADKYEGEDGQGNAARGPFFAHAWGISKAANDLTGEGDL